MTESSERPLKVLFTAMLGIGHLNACIGIASLLRKRGHDVYFASCARSRPLIEKHDLKFISLAEYQHEDHKVLEELPVGMEFFKLMLDEAMKYSPMEMLKDEVRSVEMFKSFMIMVETSKADNYAMLNIIDHLKPDICLADYLWVMPWMVKTDVPVIPVMSAAPIELYDGPPMMSGLSVHDPPELWQEYKRLKDRAETGFIEKCTELFNLFGLDYVERAHARQMGIYIYPEPLDYKELGPPAKNWVRLDSAIRVPESTEFTIPEKLLTKPGKLIYVSMGTLASMVPEMMNRILEPLASVPHRFIVSTGPNGDLVTLYDNMWGDKFVNQVALMPHIDLFITHGGCNSLIEGLAAAKPLIVIPQFGDQLNNAQRIADLKLGVKINLWEFTGEKLVSSIDQVLNNDEIKENVNRVADELKKSNSSDKVCSMIEHLARTKSSPFQ